VNVLHKSKDNQHNNLVMIINRYQENAINTKIPTELTAINIESSIINRLIGVSFENLKHFYYFAGTFSSQQVTRKQRSKERPT
jgi:hypothetical protein